VARIPLVPIGAELTEGAENRTHTRALEQGLAEKVAVVRSGWGAEYADRVREKGKLPTWDRIAALIDPGSEVSEVGTLVNWGRTFAGSKRDAPGAGVVTCFARIAGRLCVIIANDNTVASGAWWPLTPEKIERAQQMALALRVPVVYLVDCSGLFLPEQSRSFSGRTGAGHIFRYNAKLAEAGVPQVAGVFGDCIAGGGYMPIISDRVIMTEGAYMVIAGAALIRGAKSLKLTSLDIGGPEVHVHQSGCADVRAPDDPAALRLIREEIERLPTSGAAFYRHGAEPAPPRFDPAELEAIFPVDPRLTYDVEQVLARLVDSSLAYEFMPGLGREMVTVVARIGGLWCGLVANRQGIFDEPGIGRRPGGALYREGIAKISTFARTCSDDGIPLVWLQDISGFDIGVEAERLGLLGYGSNLIYANSTPTAPVFTVLLRKASGAGFYAMAGMPYEPVVQLSTVHTRLAVMEGRTLAIATYNSKLDDDFEIATEDPAERAKIEQGMVSTAARIEADMDPIGAASRMDTDEVVPVGRLRDWLVLLVEAAWQSTGYRRTKNPRIWSLHDLAVLGGRPAPVRTPAEAVEESGSLVAPTVGEWEPSIGAGARLAAGQAIGSIRRFDDVVPVTAPAAGSAREVRPRGLVQHGVALVALGELPAVAAETAEAADATTVGRMVRAETDGTVWRRGSPGGPLFADVGQVVQAGVTLALVEVMKTFTPVRSPCAGTVASVGVADGAAVEAGAMLFVIDDKTQV
jgi:acetyl-CoA carboxylase carboxyltransferase component/biotin carboxyl carrier protein